jgi:uncharacterized repeat protein (TIGR03803 family)
MLKTGKTTGTVRHLGLLLLAFAIVLPCSAAPPTLQTIYNFTGNADGAYPEAGVVLGSGGSLFGTTSGGGSGWGLVFELTPGKSGGWTEKTLYTFTGGADGAIPTSDLVIGANNVLYGTTSYGGSSTCDCGTVFQLTPAHGGTWTFATLYAFTGGTDGANPAAGLVLDSTTEVLYGTTYNGGTTNMGTLFQVGPVTGGTPAEKVLYSFQGGVDGANPIADLVIGANTTLFGTTYQGGSVTIPAGVPPCPTSSENTPCTYSNWGTVFELTPKGGGVWAETILYTFMGVSDGGSPESALIVGTGNVLYGSTYWAGSPSVCPVGGYPQGCGTIFQVTPPTSGTGPWTQSVLHTFTGVSPDGAHPYRNLAINAGGMLFGTTYGGGLNTDFCFPETFPGCGTIFSMKPPSAPGGTWTKSNITTFNGTNGGAPNGIILGTSGILYGTTVMGGTAGGNGTAFSMAVAGSSEK